MTEGQQFGHLTITTRKLARSRRPGQRVSPPPCASADAGVQVFVPFNQLAGGNYKSCGCLRGEALVQWMAKGDHRAEVAERNRTPEAREAAWQRGLHPENVER